MIEPSLSVKLLEREYEPLDEVFKTMLHSIAPYFNVPLKKTPKGTEGEPLDALTQEFHPTSQLVCAF